MDMGKVVHFEIPVDDVERAKWFYGSIFGWQLRDIPDMDYIGVETAPVDERTHLPLEPGAINGGMFRRAGDAPRTPVITIDVASVDDALRRIEASGGSVLQPRTELPGMGAFAYFTDPEGNTLGLWENA
jgi:predicted enzyme related to lactoylglutathione lyase